MHIPSVVDVELDDVNTIGKTTAKIKATTMKHANMGSIIDDNDVQHGHIVHRDLNFEHNHIIISCLRFI